ncbi:DUF3048 domain-containing protein [Streptomyces himalayensis]|uniref:DUF3048 domain-containing protein n=1 Tax=Streptomyces himalayensis subsp. himalayensis TaxID=2756131 RepID=A0A7W0IBF9_9ACTN|nr:DUF3048 domain-containing protein [Streptomyces himalayensis]MBA2949352.1 DUF3048 domain-containing protein [Streptomyces himalayensis subsp. himalayensis]
MPLGRRTEDADTGAGVDSGALTRIRRWTATVAVLTTLAVGCTTGGGPDEGSRPGERTPAPETSEPGGGGDGPVLAVKIDNVRQARPQTGLDAADVVYVEQVEGGLSRLMAVYATRLPSVVGPVRSARETDLELLRQFDRPTLAYSGAQSKLQPLIDAAPLAAMAPGKAPSGAYFRGADRVAPYNLYLRPAALKPAPKPGGLASTGFEFGAAPEGGTVTRERKVRFPAARFTFTWSADQKKWLVAMDGTAARTAEGKRLAASTVVVQYVAVRDSRFHDRWGNVSPFSETVGEGSAVVLRDGRAYDTRWERSSAEDGTGFTTAEGKRMTFAPGQVWVVLVKA